MTAPTRHPNPAKERAAAALRARRYRSVPPTLRPSRRPLRDRASYWLKYRARYVARHPLEAAKVKARKWRRQLDRAWRERLCRRLGHLDRHPRIVGELSCPSARACAYCARCGRTEHDVAPPLPRVAPTTTELAGLRAEREWLRLRFYYRTPDRSRLNAAEAYVDELAATYGLDQLNAHRLARGRIESGEWSPPQVSRTGHPRRWTP